mmetsp:Transcript_27974/g.58794  ORF Transcript_27974/g.58794 Transcript_27974/m.58794 type:complete len:156 (+) Transcript_27974:55-522(+)
MMTSDNMIISEAKRPLFLHMQFDIPSLAIVNNDVEGGSIQNGVESASVKTAATKRVDQWFDNKLCDAAVVGLPEGVEPVKPESGDYSFSGMHDHGTLPAPKEGGRFAQLIGFVDQGKKASDKYLTAIIEAEQVHDAQSLHDIKRKLIKNSEELPS